MTYLLRLDKKQVPIGFRSQTDGGESVDTTQGRTSLPYPVLADPTDATYARYGLGHSLKGVLDLRHLNALAPHLRHLKSTTLHDERFRMPAEFLISRTGEIEHAHYARYGADWLPTHQVLNWAMQAT